MRAHSFNILIPHCPSLSMELTLIHKEDVPGNSNTIHDQLYLNLKYLLQLIIAKVLLLEVAGLVFILSDTAASDVVHAVLCYVGLLENLRQK